jgi:PAS domain S-box-containing protein
MNRHEIPAKQREEYVADILLQQAFECELQPTVISIVGEGRIVRANRSACVLLGYTNLELLTKHQRDIFRLTDIDFKTMTHELRSNGNNTIDADLIKKNGKYVSCVITSSGIRDVNGVSHSVSTILVREDGPLSKSVMDETKTNDWINSIVKISYDLICDWDLRTDLISFGSNYSKIFGYELPNQKIRFQDWIELFPASERTAVENKLRSILQSESMNWEYAFKFICPDGSVSQVLGRANIIRDKGGKAIRVIGIIHDVSKEQKLEVKLEREVKIKEKQIVEAIVEAKEMERSDLGKELHDNVNQLLGASILYLDVARNDFKNGETYLIHASEYTQAAIEEIRKLTKGLASYTIGEFGLSGAIGQIIKDTKEVNALEISFKLDQSLEDQMSDKFKLNTFRICQEQLNNILKHSKASKADIAFSTTRTELKFYITDNGIGFDSKQKANGIGMSNILSRAKLYKGSAEFTSEPGEGCKLALRFPLLSIY